LDELSELRRRDHRHLYLDRLARQQFDVKWVMGQVGHADSKMTLDVYAQLEQRVDRRHEPALID
jgi:integrase